MDRAVTFAELEEEISKELINAKSPSDVCPYLMMDDESRPYCGKGSEEGEPTEERLMVCDNASLQLWCLDDRRYGLCSYYNGELIVG